MKDLHDIGKQMIAGELTKEERRVAGRVIGIVGYRLAVVVVLLWAFGVFEPMRLGGGFAFADDVHQQTNEAIAPLSERLQKVEHTLRDQVDETKRLRDLFNSEKLANLESKMIESKIRQCKADTDTARSYFRERVLEFRRQIADVAPGRAINEPSCAEL